ncbi:hypothetical protein GC209_07085 [bacterium]|nr:hypothetical protein [bacterium]
MKKIALLALSLSLAASMALSQVDDAAKKQAALKQLQTLAPQTTAIGGVAVADLSLAAILVAIAAILANGASSTSSS